MTLICTGQFRTFVTTLEIGQKMDASHKKELEKISFSPLPLHPYNLKVHLCKAHTHTQTHTHYVEESLFEEKGSQQE